MVNITSLPVASVYATLPKETTVSDMKQIQEKLGRERKHRPTRKRNTPTDS